jgi:FkbM family methyltransferase
MGSDQLLHELNKVNRLAKAPKLVRLLNNPYRYLNALAIRYFNRHKGSRLVVNTFFNRPMLIGLPASTDIYLTGGKSHDSEIRLAGFLIKNLDKGARFLDIGAHFGYFSLLASELAGREGAVVSFEPGPGIYSMLRENASHAVHGNIVTYPHAVSDQEGELSFYELPAIYSEYSSMDLSQFENESWFRDVQPNKITVQAASIDKIVRDGFIPEMIKIDVEGAESKVIAGGARFFQQHEPYVIMEYLEPARHNQGHKHAVELMRSYGYTSYAIDAGGNLRTVHDIDAYLVQEQIGSDNIVFSKK